MIDSDGIKCFASGIRYKLAALAFGDQMISTVKVKGWRELGIDGSIGGGDQGKDVSLLKTLDTTSKTT